MAERFPPEVAAVLRKAGWFEGRRTDAEAAVAIGIAREEVGRSGERHEPFPAATEALNEFGGIFVIQDGPGRDLRRRPFAIDPTPVAASTETLADLGKHLGARLFPIGMEGDHDSILAIDETGRVYALDHAGTWFLGGSIAAALITLVTGTQPPRLDGRGNWHPAPPAAPPAPAATQFLVTRVWDLPDRDGLVTSGKKLAGKLKQGIVLSDEAGRTTRVLALEFLSPRDIATGEVTILLERTRPSPVRPGALLTERRATC